MSISFYTKNINYKLSTNKHLFALLNSFKFAFIKNNTTIKDNEQYNHNHKF